MKPLAAASVLGAMFVVVTGSGVVVGGETRVMPPSSRFTGGVQQAAACAPTVANARRHDIRLVVAVKRWLPRVTVVDSLSRAAIARIRSGYADPPRVFPAGLTHSTSLTTHPPTITWESWRAPAGDLWCYWAKRIEAGIGIDSLTIYIAREYPKGSCLYAGIFHHENRHLVEAVQRVERYAARLESELAAATFVPTPRRPLTLQRDSISPIRNRIERAVDDIYEEIRDDLRAEMEGESPLDTPEERQRVFGRCPGGTP